MGYRFWQFNYLIFTLLLIPAGLSVSAENRPGKSYRPAYLEFSCGPARSLFRDSGTSPLIYRGFLFEGGAGYSVCSADREMSFGIHALSGIHTRETPGRLFRSSFNGLAYHFRLLTGINLNTGEKWICKAGGSLSGITDVRQNSDLYNAYFVLESFNTLFACGSIERRFSHPAKERKFFFIRIRQRDRNFSLSYRLDIPLLNTAWRPGYAYVADAANGKEARETLRYNDLKAGGFRITSGFSLVYHLHNLNAFRLTYTWDALKTRGVLNRMEMARHSLTLTFMFKLNQKKEK